jgi:hypothetical protein
MVRAEPTVGAQQVFESGVDSAFYSQNTAAVASFEGTLTGIAMSGPSLEDNKEQQQLHLLYAYAAFYGSGVATELLNAVVEPTAPAALGSPILTRGHKPLPKERICFGLHHALAQTATSPARGRRPSLEVQSAAM